MVMHNVLYLISGFEGYTKRERYSHLRPRVRVMENPSGWWKYAYNAICMDSRERSKAYLPEVVARRRRIRLEYMKLWKRKCVGNSLVTIEDELNSKHENQQQQHQQKKDRSNNNNNNNNKSNNLTKK